MRTRRYTILNDPNTKHTASLLRQTHLTVKMNNSSDEYCYSTKQDRVVLNADSSFIIDQARLGDDIHDCDKMCHSTTDEVKLDDDHASYSTEEEDEDEEGYCMSNDGGDENSINRSIYVRPIVVGYAFGPKKMSTMGVVMAEASKAKLSAVTTTSSPHTNVSGSSETIPSTREGSETNEAGARAELSLSSSTLTRARLTTHEGNYVFTVDCGPAGSRQHGDLRHIVQHFRSSCSSVGDDDGNGSYSREEYSAVSTTSSFRSSGGCAADCDGESRGTLQTACSTCTPLSIAPTTNATVTSTKGGYHNNQTAATTPLRRPSRTQQHARRSIVSATAAGNAKSHAVKSSSSWCGISSVASSSGTRTTTRFPTSSHPHTTTVPIRVSFVPLDLDMPLEEQHGGKMDVILHKLTEDILFLSQMSTESQSTQTDDGRDAKIEAVQRVQRLMDFAQQHPECSLVDNPLSVRTVMSRAEIAVTLESCLRNCRTVSGCPVGSPAYTVLWGNRQQPNLDGESNDPAVFMALAQEQVQNLSFPIIVKPLTAAGTKASHAMAILMDRTALHRLQNVPCLCQEYSNHDAVLYKVYVLGNHVSVHKRRSLPNLPVSTRDNDAATTAITPTTTSQHGRPKNYIEFDSQRPYPRLEDFGFVDDSTGNVADGDTLPPPRRLTDRDAALALIKGSSGGLTSKMMSNESALTTVRPTTGTVLVTAAEVQPIVDALKSAFGLELFGFDILVTSAEEQQQRMLVVDVNYFPSYKEVANFPALLAKYLTDRAVASRRSKLYNDHLPLSQSHPHSHRAAPTGLVSAQKMEPADYK